MKQDRLDEVQQMISDEEHTWRQYSIEEARASVRFEGLILGPEIDEINRRYIEGELTGDEHVAAVQAIAFGVSPAPTSDAYSGSLTPGSDVAASPNGAPATLPGVPTPAYPADGPWLEGSLPVAPPGETEEQRHERVAEIMGRMSRDENLRRHFAKWLS